MAERFNKKSCRGSTNNWKGARFSIEVFLRVWNYIEAMCAEKEYFALHWLMKDEARLKLFLSCIGQLDVPRLSKGLLVNGYNNCKNSPVDADSLSNEMWNKASTLFHTPYSFSNLPLAIRHYIDALSRKDIDTFRNSQEVEWRSEMFEKKAFGFRQLEVKKITSNLLEECSGLFLGVLDDEGRKLFNKPIDDLFRTFPKEFFIASTYQGYTSFYDNSGERPELVTVVISRGDQLGQRGGNLIRFLYETLFVAHREIKRRSKASFASHMVGFGPLFNCYVAGTNKVSFYTSLLKVKDLVDTCNSPEAFQDLIDRHAPSELIDILVGLFMWWCPNLLRTFLEYSDPYLAYPDYDKVDFETLLGGKGPSAYQLYITKDYCLEMHKDVDATDFTICYASHPDSHVSPIDFVIGEYGLRLPIGNKDVFAFKSRSAHATGYRSATSNAAYVGCLAVNSPLASLMARRRK